MSNKVFVFSSNALKCNRRFLLIICRLSDLKKLNICICAFFLQVIEVQIIYENLKFIF